MKNITQFENIEQDYGNSVLDCEEILVYYKDNTIFFEKNSFLTTKKIDGNVDFIFGSAIALFDSCVVYAKSRTTAGSSYITAPNTPNGQAYGFV